MIAGKDNIQFRVLQSADNPFIAGNDECLLVLENHEGSD